jgi:hypothetical protein
MVKFSASLKQIVPKNGLIQRNLKNKSHNSLLLQVTCYRYLCEKFNAVLHKFRCAILCVFSAREFKTGCRPDDKNY